MKNEIIIKNHVVRIILTNPFCEKNDIGTVTFVINFVIVSSIYKENQYVGKYNISFEAAK